MWERFKEYSANLMLVFAGVVGIVVMMLIVKYGEARIIEGCLWIVILDFICMAYAIGLGTERQIKDMKKRRKKNKHD